jgi:hypothetical protein
MARAGSSYPDDLSDVTFATFHGRVTREQVYERRTGRTSGVAVREMWIRDGEGEEWHLNANAQDAVVRGGHRVHVLVAMRGAECWVLRMRNLSTGDDQTLEETVRRVGGEAYPAAAFVGGITGVALVSLGTVLSLVASLLNVPISEWVWLVLAALPLALAIVVGRMLAPGLRRRRELLWRRAEEFDEVESAA